MNQLRFKFKSNKHVLIPDNEVSEKAQNVTFEWFIKLQLNLINKYDSFNEDEKYKYSNMIGEYFVKCFFNGDGATFRSLVGYEHKGLMTKEELKNVKRDYDIAVKKVKNKEFKVFLLLDIIPSSNRRADAIVITNNYEIELYDFSEGIVAEKIKNKDISLNKSEEKQRIRKEKQAKRIESYKNKINVDCTPINDIIIDNKSTNVIFYNLNTKFYDLNFAYEIFRRNNYNNTYIPNSLCFLMKKENSSFPFVSMSLKHRIDNPFFITEGKPIIKESILTDIYEKNIYIGISLYYAKLFITNFTNFNIKLSKRVQSGMEKSHFYITKNRKKRYVYLEDSRTGNWISVGIGILEKHMFMNIDLESIIIYLAKACNKNDDENFARGIIKYDKLKDSEFDFFILQ